MPESMNWVAGLDGGDSFSLLYVGVTVGSSRCVMPKTRDFQRLRILGLCLTGIDSLPRYSPIGSQCPETTSRFSISALLHLNLLSTLSILVAFFFLFAPFHISWCICCWQVNFKRAKDPVLKCPLLTTLLASGGFIAGMIR
jgi:hypothetical protein